MKSKVCMIIAVTMLFLVIITVAANYIYMHDITERLLDNVDALPKISNENALREAQKFSEMWQKSSPIIGLSVSYSQISYIDSTTAALISFAESGDSVHYSSQIMLLREAIAALPRNEKMSFLDIF